MRKIYSTLLNASIVLMTIAPVAGAAEVRGVFKYQDTTTVVPIRRAYVEVWYHGTGFFDFWNVVGSTTTGSDGSMSFVDTRSNGTYSLRIYAMNDAAIVWPTDLHFTPYYAATMQLSPASASSVLDFSTTFTDSYISRHFNLANTAQIGYDFATARRDPLETDVLRQVNIQPTSWVDSNNPTGIYYWPSTTTITVQVNRTFEDLTILHEYGHHVEFTISRVAGWPSFHDGCVMRTSKDGFLINSPEYAWVEAFADYFAQAVIRAFPSDSSLAYTPGMGGPTVSQLEAPSACSVIGSTSQAGVINASMVESRIAAALWDLLDSYGNPAQGVDAHDRVAGEGATVFQIFDRELGAGAVTNIFSFRDAWRARGKDSAALDCILSAYEILPETPGCSASGAVKLVGRFNPDNKDDIALTGVPGWGSIPVALSNGDGSFNVVNQLAASFPALAAQRRVAKLTGDFNGDGLTDIALSGGSGWGSIPVALSDGNGGFTIVNQATLPMFPDFAADPEAQKLVGDFDGDGLTDIALIGPPGWTTVPIAFSDGAGGFRDRNAAADSLFAFRASILGARTIVGDFDGDGRSDLLIVSPGATMLPLARFDTLEGAFHITYIDAGLFAQWSTARGAQILVGDFNGDHITDLALSGVAGWNTVPVLRSNAGGSHTLVNLPVGSFGDWSASLSAVRLVGDFTGDGTTDIALTGVPGWGSVPVAWSSAGSFTVANPAVGDFAAWAAAGALTLVGDFNGDGKQDIALTGLAGWTTIPVAFASFKTTARPAPVSTLSFTITNKPTADFPGWAATK